MIQKIIFFGASVLGEQALKEKPDNVDVIFFLDNDINKAGTFFHGIEIQTPEILKNLEYDSILITSQYVNEISPQLLALGVPREKLKIYNVDFLENFPPAPIVMMQPPSQQTVIESLLGMDLPFMPNWHNVPAEKAVLTSILRSIKPKCSIEIGTYLGDSLRVIHHFSDKCYSLDTDPSCEEKLTEELSKTEFIVGDSQRTLPELLNKIEKDVSHPPVEFVLVDGCHTKEGVERDLNALMNFVPKSRMVILMHDAFNPGCREGMTAVNWAENPYVHYVNLDFVPGILHYIDSSYREMWGGFAFALLLPTKREFELEILTPLSQHFDALYQGSNHQHERENPFSSYYLPMFSAGSQTIKFTACLPNYNHGSIIEKAVLAMLSQSRPPDELLICDDASTDNSWEILNKLQKKYPVIRLIKNEKNIGVVGTLNKLLANAKGEYVYFGGADDYVLPLFFENVLQLLSSNPQASLGMSSFYSVNEEGEILSHNKVSRWKTPGYYEPDACMKGYFSVEGPHHSLSSGTIYRKIDLQKINGFEPQLGHWTDSFAIRVLSLQSGCVYTPYPGAMFTCSDKSFSGSQHRELETSLAIINKAACMMRSTAFKTYFPENFVINWQTEFIKLAHTLCEQSLVES